MEDYTAFAKLGEEYGDATLNIRNSVDKVKAQSDKIAETVSGIDLSIKDISNAVADSAIQIEKLSGAAVNVSDSMNELLTLPILSCKK